MEESKKWVYLYRITLIKNEENLYYFGIRTFKGDSANNDTYLGSPTTYAYLWEDTSGYEIKKDIIREELYSEEMLHELRDLEIKLIKEAWKKYGVYHKDENGKCLNAGILKCIIYTKEVRSKMSDATKEYYKNNPNTPEARAKHSAVMKEYYKNNPITPEARAKHSAVMKEYYKNNPITPELIVKNSNAMKKYYLNNPEARAKLSAAKKEHYKNNPNTPEARAKHSAVMKEYYKNNPITPEARAKLSAAKKEHYKNNPELLVKNSNAMKKYYLNNPEARAKLSAAKKEHYRKKRLEKELCQTF